MPKHFCFIQQHRFICLHASVGFQLSKRRTWVMPFLETGCWCWLVWNSNIVDFDSVVERYKKKLIPLRETAAHWHQLHRWQECKTGVRSRLAIRCIKTVFRLLKSWGSHRETRNASSWDVYTCKSNNSHNREAAQWCSGYCCCLPARFGMVVGISVWSLCSPLCLITVLSLTVHTHTYQVRGGPLLW